MPKRYLRKRGLTRKIFDATIQKPIIRRAKETDNTISRTKLPLYEFRKVPMVGTFGIKKKCSR